MKKQKLNDNQKLDNYNKRKILRFVIMVMSVFTIILAVLSLTIKLGFGYAVVSYIITHVLISMRNKLEIKEEETEKKDTNKKKNNKKTKKSSKNTNKKEKTTKKANK